MNDKLSPSVTRTKLNAKGWLKLEPEGQHPKSQAQKRKFSILFTCFCCLCLSVKSFFLGGIQIKAHIKWFPPHRQDNFYLFNPGTCAGNFSSAETFVHILCSCFRTEDELCKRLSTDTCFLRIILNLFLWKLVHKWKVHISSGAL